MSQLWVACAEAVPLAALPPQKIQGIAKRFQAFYRTFRCFRRILRYQHTTLESYHEFQQTWDECNDFLYHNPGWRLMDTSLQTTLLHEISCYVYNDSDLDILQRRLDLQLHVMNAKLDDIILNQFSVVLRQSDLLRMPHVMIAVEPAPSYEYTLPSALTPIEQNTWELFKHLVELRGTLRTKAPPLGAVHCERLWTLIVARFKEHELPSHDRSPLLFSRTFKLGDKKLLREYSQDTLKQRQSSYRTLKPTSSLRRRVYSYEPGANLATLRLDSLEEEECLDTVDVVTYREKRWVVSTRNDREMGFVQHLPSISEIHPYTKHDRFNAPEIRLYEACIVDETDGSVTWRYEGRKPSYTFDSEKDATAFQCALRGKILLRTFQAETITSERGSEGTAQPLKLWSDLDGRNLSVSFLLEEIKPYYHIDVPLRLLENAIHTSDSEKNIRVTFASQKTRKGRNSMNKTGFLRRLSDFLRHSPPDAEHDSDGRDSRPGTADSLTEEDLAMQDIRFLVSLGYLRFEFTTSDDARSFQIELADFFTRKRQTEPLPGHHPSISRENSEAPDSPTTVVVPGPVPVPVPVPGPETPCRKEAINPFKIPNTDEISPIRIPHRPSIGNNTPSPVQPPAQRRASKPTENEPSPPPTKDLDYRVRGIKPEHAGPTLLSYLSHKLGIEPNIVGRVKTLATSQTGDKVAVIAWRPQPACLSTPGKDEWDFGPTSDDDDIHITVDTHFRGVTILYSPPPELPHTLDVCAVAGLGGHAWGSFKHKSKSQSFMWVVDGLKEHLPTARLMTYGSKTKLDGNESTQTLEDLGKLLRDEMRSVTRRRSQSVLSTTSTRLGTGFSVPSFFIAHSLGGLTVKEALLQERKHPEPGSFIYNLQGALFFGVPSHGMNIKVLEAMIKGQPNEFLVKSISYQSPTLRELSRKFKSKFSNKIPKIIYFYEMERSFAPKQLADGQWKMEGEPKEILVDLDSATDGELWTTGHVNTHPLNRNHSDLVKFSSPNDADFQRVLNVLTKLVDDADAIEEN